jgi:hypothetical protein
MPTPEKTSSVLHCPSTQATEPEAFIFGAVIGPPEARRIGYLTEVQPITERLLDLAGPLKPGQVFRSASPCIGNACKHYDGTGCKLAERVASLLDPVVNALPNCQIRLTCRWFRQEGRAACLRCPQIITDEYGTVEEYRRVGDPDYVEPSNIVTG